MEMLIIPIGDLTPWINQLPSSFIIRLLFGGDRIRYCDEAVTIKEGGEIVGIATIAPQGEGTGIPTIVALYILPSSRRQGYGKILFSGAIQRCKERGFTKIRVDVFSRHVVRMIPTLSEEDRKILDVRVDIVDVEEEEA